MNNENGRIMKTSNYVPFEEDALCYFCNEESENTISFCIPPSTRYHIPCLVDFMEETRDRVEDAVAKLKQ